MSFKYSFSKPDHCALSSIFLNCSCLGAARVLQVKYLHCHSDDSFEFETFNFILITYDDYILSSFSKENNHELSRKCGFYCGLGLDCDVFKDFF